MRAIGTAVALGFLAAMVGSAALAQGRPDSTALTCAQAAQLVQSWGALVLDTGGQTYDRYVRDRGFCEVTQTTTRRFVPTRDNPACFVGYTCREPSRDDFFGND